MISLETLALAKKYTEKYVQEHGGGGGGGKEYVKYDTTAAWNAKGNLKSERGILYVYSDHESYEDAGKTVYVPGIKVGDGTSLLSALPFINVLEAYFPSGGADGDVLIKTASGPSWVTPADEAVEGDPRPITSAAVLTAIEEAIDEAVGDVTDALIDI